MNIVEIETITGEKYNTEFDSDQSGVALDKEIEKYYLKNDSYIKIHIDDKTTRYIKTDNIKHVDFFENLDADALNYSQKSKFEYDTIDF